MVQRASALTVAAMSLGYGVVQLDVTIVNVAINTIGQSVGGSVDALQWVVNAYTIAFAALILSAGALGDRIGARRVFIAGFAIFTAASLACALAPTLAILIGARLIQGVGAAVLVPNSLALLNHAHPEPERRQHAVAIWAAGASLALTAGPLIGGALIALSGWRSIFIVNVPIGLIGLWLTVRYAQETERAPAHRLDLLGQAAAMLALTCLAAAMIEGGRLGWGDRRVAGSFVAALVLLAAFIRVEQRSLHPMLPLQLFSSAEFSIASLAGLLVNIAFYGMIFVFSLYFQRLHHFSALRTGLAFVPMSGAILATNLIASRATALAGARAIIALGAAIGTVGSVALLPIAADSSYLSMLVPLMAMGAGLGLLVPPLNAIMLGSVAKTQSGIASGVLNSMRQSGSVVGVALLGSLVAQQPAFMSGLRLALAVAAAALATACVAVLAGISGHRASDTKQEQRT
jgi:DHA2 family methylenomycin A resistance protein-like MFS transporter